MSELSELMEFDHVIAVGENGAAIDGILGVHAPVVWHSETNDIEIESDEWEPITQGMTGQHGYNGPVLHASEVIEGGVEARVLSRPGLYVAVVVEVMPDVDDPNPKPAGWLILRKKD